MGHSKRQNRRIGWTLLARRRPERCRLRPSVLMLEDRQLLATITVTSANASGNGSLAAAIATANSNAQSNTIEFSPAVFAIPQTIVLGGRPLELSDTAGQQTIDGPVASVTISGGGKSGVFVIDSGVTASLSGMSISAGSTTGSGGGMYNKGSITLSGCTISGNSASGGGGLANHQGTVTLSGCTISGNAATGPGGGLANYEGTVTLSDCTIGGNSATGAGARSTAAERRQSTIAR